MGNNFIKDKFEISFTIELLSGMHIGTSDGIAIIGAVDSIVIRDPLTRKTMIPGSSLKGKMRSLLLRNTCDEKMKIENYPALGRLFGDKSVREYARLQFVDSLLSDDSMKKLENKSDLQYSEIKFENTINPLTLEAKPRQIERALRGSEFDCKIIYTLSDENEVMEDFNNIKKGFILLENDYIGGSGSRGYGRIKIKNISVNAMNITENLNVDVNNLKDILENRYINNIMEEG